jgi:hypothetical protein
MAATAGDAYGEAALSGVPAMIAQLKGDNTITMEAREMAAWSRGRIGQTVKTNRDAEEPQRQVAGDDPDHATDVATCGALSIMEADAPKQIATMRKYLHDDEPRVRMKACHALGMG